ncbi:hypothetical protein OESDEN_14274 [Oesophagostomum dentatum]|uniref:Uncharacterized protein n=1 Tax=Oesophagostomum dentatum TaxID=61180 RepID=A0A0B1SKX3_OESDE|nr:hypothetical protein OESDEN_14274 [Oesophagostomum dentatum]
MHILESLDRSRILKKCFRTPSSNYAEIASQCDRTAVFHAFGAYLLRGHTLFTLLFLAASIMIFTITVTYHFRIRTQHDFIHSGLRDQSPHRRRERLFHTLIFSIATFFVSVLGQTYIEIAVFWVDDREEVATLTKWYHLARIAAFVDPVLNPLIVVARPPALRRQVRRLFPDSRQDQSSDCSSAHNGRHCDRVRLRPPNQDVQVAIKGRFVAPARSSGAVMLRLN